MTKDFSFPTFKVQLGDLELYTATDMRFSVTPKIHSHPYYEIIVVIDGRLTIKLLDNQAIEIEKGSLCILPPRCYHSTCSKEDLTKMLGIRLSYGQVKGEAKIYDRFKSALESIEIPTRFTSTEKMLDILLDMRNEMREKNTAWDFACNALLQKFYIEILRLLTMEDEENPLYETDDSRHTRYFRIEVWFADNLADSVTEDDLASAISLSRRQLSRVLEDIYGMSFRKKLIELRLHRAAQLLEQTELNVDDISNLVGYRSTSGFHRAFCKYFGCSPYDYRKKHHERRRQL